MTPEMWLDVCSALGKVAKLSKPQQVDFLKQMRRTNPEVAEEVEALLKEQDEASDEPTSEHLTQEPDHGSEIPTHTEPIPDQPMLLVVGTPYCYQAAPKQERITVGRKRRKTDQSENEGNDFVIRVENSAKRSLLISRRHFEIYQSGTDYFLTDVSKHGSKLNNVALRKHEPTRLRNGDRIEVAGVLTLQFCMGSNTTTAMSPSIGSLRTAMTDGDLLMEVSRGELLSTDNRES